MWRVNASVTLKDRPGDLAPLLNGGVIISSDEAGTVTLLTGGQVAATVRVGDSPLSAVQTLDGRIYVPNNGDGTVSVIRGGAVESVLPVQSFGLEGDSSGNVYAAASEKLTTIQNGRVKRVDQVGVAVTGAQVANDAAYILEWSEPYTLDIMRNGHMQKIDLPAEPESVAVGSGGYTYVSLKSTESPTIAVIENNRVTSAIQVEHSGYDLVSDSNGVVYASPGDITDEGIVLLLRDGRLDRQVKLELPVDALAAGKDGTVFAANTEAGEVYVINDGAVIGHLHLDGNPTRLLFGREGVLYAVDPYQRVVFVIGH